MRWRDSGEVEPPRRAARKAADGNADGAEGEGAGLAPDRDEAEQGEQEHGHEHRPAPAAEVSSRLPEVGDDRPRAAELGAAAADADVEAPGEDEVGEPEGDPCHGHGGEREDGLSQAVPPGREDEHPLGREHERAVGMGGDGEHDREPPQRPRPPRAPVEGAEQEHEREQREEQEEAVHPRVDAVEEEDPAAGHEGGRDQGVGASGEAPAEQRHERQASHRERRRDEPQAAEPESEVGDRVGEEEVERRAAPLPGHVSDDTREAVAPDEEGERLVLMRRPGHQLVLQEGGRRQRDRRDAEPEGVRGDERARRGGERAGVGGRLRRLCHRRSRHMVAGRLAA